MLNVNSVPVMVIQDCCCTHKKTPFGCSLAVEGSTSGTRSVILVTNLVISHEWEKAVILVWFIVLNVTFNNIPVIDQCCHLIQPNQDNQWFNYLLYIEDYI
jgi:hypothetical protein